MSITATGTPRIGIKQKKPQSGGYTSNSITRKTNTLLNVVFAVYCILCVAPLILIFTVSITDSASLVEQGYTFFPKVLSLTSYRYLFLDPSKIIRAYGMSIAVCTIGTLTSVIMVMLYAYPLSRKSFKARNFFAFYIFFTMLFNGGLVPWYIMYTKYLGLKDNPVMLVIPGLVSAFNVLIVKTFFSLNLPDSILESAKIDGAGEGRIFVSIVIPLSTPVIATIGAVLRADVLERLVCVPVVHRQPQVLQHSVRHVPGAENGGIPHILPGAKRSRHAGRVGEGALRDTANGNGHYRYRSYRICVSILSEILHQGPDHRRRQGISRTCTHPFSHC